MPTLDHAVSLCVRIEAVAPRFGFHTGLTGGCLYKSGQRKDIDVVLYVRGNSDVRPDKEGLVRALAAEVGLVPEADYGYVVKTQHAGISVDLLFPSEDGNYGVTFFRPNAVDCDGDDFDDLTTERSDS